MNNEWKVILQNERANSSELITKLFAKNLLYWRKDNHLTQGEVAKKLRIPVSTYANWEQGRRLPSLVHYYELMLALEIDANDLFFGI